MHKDGGLVMQWVLTLPQLSGALLHAGLENAQPPELSEQFLVDTVLVSETASLWSFISLIMGRGIFLTI